MAKPRNFSTASVSAMHDPKLNAQDWRIYLWVSLHDGRSLVRGSGGGCFASNNTIFAEAKVANYSSGCRSLSTLVERGHLVREKRGRATVYRVPFSDADNFADDLHGCNISSPHEAAAESPTIGCEAASNAETIGYNGSSETRGNQPKTDQDYSPLSGELDSVETGRINSVETAQRASRAARREEYSPGPDDDEHFLESAYRANTPGKEKDCAEAPLGRENMIEPLLPRSFWTLPQGAQLVHLDAALNELGSRVDDLMDAERDAWAELLVGIWDAHSGVSLGRHAERLHAKMTYREEAA